MKWLYLKAQRFQILIAHNGENVDIFLHWPRKPAVLYFYPKDETPRLYSKLVSLEIFNSFFLYINLIVIFME